MRDERKKLELMGTRAQLHLLLTAYFISLIAHLSSLIGRRHHAL